MNYRKPIIYKGLESSCSITYVSITDILPDQNKLLSSKHGTDTFFNLCYPRFTNDKGAMYFYSSLGLCL